MSQLHYRIADQYITIHTPSPTATASMLANYEPFRHHHIPDHREVLLEVWGGYAHTPSADDRLIEQVEDVCYKSRVYRLGDGRTRIEMKYQGRMEIAYFSADWHQLHCCAPLDKQEARYLIDRFIMIAFCISTIKLRMLKVHASVTELHGRALVFMGVSGTGKSTHSRLWHQYVPDCTLLNDDEPIVRVMPDGSVRVYGCPWSGSTPCYRDEWADVAAFVHLYQSPENRLTKLPGRLALESLFSSSAFMLSEPQIRLQVFEIIADILSSVSVYRLDCRPDAEAVTMTRTLLP